MRWLTITPANQPNLELALMPAEGAEKALVGKQGGEKPFLCFATDDCKKMYQELKDKGVQFVSEPTEEPWGVSAAFKDIDGNVLYMCQAR
jgi:predicted enzyme related to lactoylglutathione lyase